MRSEERADVAAHLHDSVLQTLALIQRSAGDPATVTRLARAQERDLRSWLFDSTGEGPATLAAALRAVAAEVEDAHGVHVEVVCVGDAPVSEEDRPLVLATREAITNAAQALRRQHGRRLRRGHPDRGRGVRARPRRRLRRRRRSPTTGRASAAASSAGWSATAAPPSVRSVPGEGTEVRLSLPTRATDPRRHRMSPQPSSSSTTTPCSAPGCAPSSAPRSTSWPRPPTSTRPCAAVHRAPARGGAARRAPARRRRRRGDAAYDGQGGQHPLPGPLASPTRPRT